MTNPHRFPMIGVAAALALTAALSACGEGGSAVKGGSADARPNCIDARPGVALAPFSKGCMGDEGGRKTFVVTVSIPCADGRKLVQFGERFYGGALWGYLDGIAQPYGGPDDKAYAAAYRSCR